MAKRRPKYKQQADELAQRQALLRKIGLIVILVVSLLFGLSIGYPIAVAGDVMQGVLKGLAYGGGALAVLLISVFLNRKLKGY